MAHWLLLACCCALALATAAPFELEAGTIPGGGSIALGSTLRIPFKITGAPPPSPSSPRPLLQPAQQARVLRINH